MSLCYLALGDSYTLGQGVAAHECWPMQLAACLRRHHVALADPGIVAVTGWTTDELWAGMDRADLHPPYDLVSLLIGVNNQYRGRSSGTYRQEFRELLRRAITLAGARPQRTLVASIPDWGVTAYGQRGDFNTDRIGHELDVFNAIARDETGRAGTSFASVTDLSRRFPFEVTADGLHPSAAQYTRWVERIEPVARAILRR